VFSVVTPDPPTGTKPDTQHFNTYIPSPQPTSFYPSPNAYVNYQGSSYPYPAIPLSSQYAQLPQGNAPYFGAASSDRIFPTGGAFSSAEDRFRAILAAVGNIVRAFSGIAHVLDSTFYAAWSAMMAIVAVGEQLKNLRTEVLSKWLYLLRHIVKWFLGLLGRRVVAGPNMTTAIPSEIVRSYSGAVLPSKSEERGSTIVLTRWLIPMALVSGSLYYYWRIMKERKPWTGGIIMAKALFPFDGGEDSRYVGIVPGDDLVLPRDAFADAHGWVYGKNNRSGLEGYFPAAYIQQVDSHQ
jgi:hypothetical protein